MTIGIVAYLAVRKGSEAEFEVLFARQSEAVRRCEPGNELYKLFRSRSEPNEYMVMELYRDQTAVEAHSSGAHLQATRQLIAEIREAAHLNVFDSV